MSSPKLNIISTLLVTVIVTVLALTCEGTKNFLLSGEKLNPGQSLDEGAYSLRMQTVCNLVLFDNNKVIWTSNTASTRICSANMQRDGNFVIYDTRGVVVWASNSWQGGIRDYVLVLLADRNLAIFGPRIWHTGTSVKSVGGNVVHTVANGTVGEGFIQSQNATIIVEEISPHTPTLVAKGMKNVLRSGEQLDVGESLNEGAYSLRMQSVCNLALFDNNKVIWTSNAGSNRNCAAHMQRDGNFVIYGGGGVVWASHSWQGGSRSYVLVLQADRNIVIYGPARWETRTYVKNVGGNVVHTVVANGTVGEGFIQSQNATMIVGEISLQNATAAVGKVVAAAL